MPVITWPKNDIRVKLSRPFLLTFKSSAHILAYGQPWRETSKYSLPFLGS